MFKTVPHFAGDYRGAIPVEAGAPPSTYAVAGVLTGEPAAIGRLAGLTVLRAVFIAPGLWFGAKLLPGAKLGVLQSVVLGVSASITISLGMLGWYYLKSAVVKP